MSLQSTIGFAPLAGFRVLDLSQGVAGPYCAQLMLDQGAEVIKVEPAQGDWGRHVGLSQAGHSTLSTTYNRGKLSLAIDAKHPHGRDILLRLAQTADVIVQNYRPQVVRRLGLDFSTLCELGMSPVYVSISGYGSEGPYADHPATDSVMQADSGLMFTNRDSSGTPQRVGFLLADLATGIHAAQAATAALLQRMRTGQGHHVELNLFEVCCALQSTALSEELWRQTQGISALPTAVSAPNGIFEAADGCMTILALNNEQFERICTAFNVPHWMQDPRFASNELRLQHKDVLHAALREIVRSYSIEALAAVLQAHEVLHARVRDAQQVVAHPQAQERGTFQTLEQPGLGTVLLAPLAVGETRVAVKAAPAIGQHTIEILRNLGVSEHEQAALLKAGVIATS